MTPAEYPQRPLPRRSIGSILTFNDGASLPGVSTGRFGLYSLFAPALRRIVVSFTR